jgi:D-alanyl-lipoteichoic acid acyltransferase DltB (MBOAT superfamily)
MLFNSYSFLFAFLPLTLAGYFLLARRDHRQSAVWMAVMSVAFYGYWNVAYVPLLLASIVFNFRVGGAIARAAERSDPRRTRLLLAAGVTANLLLLGYFKYAGFLIANLDAAGAHFVVPQIVLPLGISFFTFTQIAFLVDAARGLAREYSFSHYTLFVSYFPHLIAGPILHHKEMIPQFRDPANYRFNSDNFSRGLTYFALGLFKKVVLADGVARFVAPGFQMVANGTPLDFIEAWLCALSYTLQLYFDFSGYCDMAVGLSWLFNVRLPFNFDSPYKATNIIDFWRRWHMTLSRFLRDYLYIALGGNRRGRARRYVNLLLTMLLGGLWHGASWTFVVWGALHGVYLMINHAWQAMRGPDHTASRAGRIAARALTLLAVIVAWVFFRASSVQAAGSMLYSMTGLRGAHLPRGLGSLLGDHMRQPLEAAGLHFDGWGAAYGGLVQVIWVVLLMAACLLLPNTQEWIEGRGGRSAERLLGPFRVWTPHPVYAAVLGLAAAWCVLHFGRLSEFLYFQF